MISLLAMSFSIAAIVVQKTATKDAAAVTAGVAMPVSHVKTKQNESLKNPDLLRVICN